MLGGSFGESRGVAISFRHGNCLTKRHGVGLFVKTTTSGFHTALPLFKDRCRVRFAEVPIPEWIPDAVAALDPNHGASRAVVPALPRVFVTDPARADRRSLSCFVWHGT